MKNRFGLIIRRKIFIIIFIILMVFAGLIIYWYALNIREKNRLASENVNILTAKTEIKAGTRLTEDIIEKQKIPRKIFNKNFITDLNDISGKTILEDISAGEIITNEMVQGLENSDEKYLKFSASIPPGLRAVSIPVNYYGEKSLPDIGDRVDIISIFFDSKNDTIVCNTVLQRKEIILMEGRSHDSADAEDAVDSGNIDGSGPVMLGGFDGILTGNEKTGSSSGPVIMTFYLSPNEVERIFLSLESGTLNASVCPGGNENIIED